MHAYKHTETSANDRTVRKSAVLSIVAILVITGLSYGMIECGAFESNIYHGHTILDHFPKYTLVSMLTLVSVVALFFALTGLLRTSAVLVSTISMIMGFVNFHMFRYHSSLFVKADLFNFRSAVNVMSTYGFIIDKYTITISVCYALSLLLAIRFLRASADKKPVSRISSFLLSAVFLFCAYFSPFAVTNDFGSGMGFNWDSLYAKFGVIPVLADNLKSELGSVHRPAGYDPNLLNALSAPEDSSTSEYPDVILILNETYYDLNEITDIKTDIDYMQNYNALTNAIKGYAAIPGIGGGTNGSEYQYLTSNSLNLFTVGSPFTSMNMNQQHSAADYMKSLGYATVAAHPGFPATYRRQSCWPLLGFDEIYFEEDFSSDYYGERKYLTDSAAFDDFLEMMDGLEPDKPHFGYLLTIQNHGGWDMNDASLDLVHAETENESISSEIDEFLSCMYLSDQAIAHMTEVLTKYYERTGRNVIVCMLGDHGPSFMNAFFDDSMSDAEYMRFYQTPYFIWANYPIDLSDEYPEVDVCDLAPITFKAAGIPLSPYYQTILDTVNAGVISKSRQLAKAENDASDEVPQYIDSKYTLHSFDEDSEQAELMKQYFYLEYNNCGDTAHRKDAYFFPENK